MGGSQSSNSSGTLCTLCKKNNSSHVLGTLSSDEDLWQDSSNLQSNRKMFTSDGSSKRVKDDSRQNVFGNSIDVPDDYHCPVNEKCRKIVELIDRATLSNPLFEDMDKNLKNLIIGAMEPYEAKRGDVIIRQGEVGHHFYVIERGFIDFYVDGKFVGKSSTGKCFGELALIYDAPRAASVIISSEKCKLWRVAQITFRRTLRNESMKEMDEVFDLLKGVELLSGLDSSYLKKIARALNAEEYKKSDIILKKGDIGDKFYIVKEGIVSLTDIGAGSVKYDDKNCTPGSHFGERALAQDTFRAANAVAVTDCVLLTLTKSQFTTLLGPLEDLLRASLDKMKLRAVPQIAKSEPSEEELDAMVRHDNVNIVWYDENETIMRENEVLSDPSIFIVTSGYFIFTKDGNEIKRVSGGDFFGEEFIQNQTKPAEFTIVAFAQDDGTPAVCTLIPISSIFKIFGGYSRFTSEDHGSPKTRINRQTYRMSTVNMFHEVDQERIFDPTLTLSDVEKIKNIGSGVFGRVYLVRNKKNKKVMAMKVQKKRKAINMKQVPWIIREKEFLFAFDHPFIIAGINTFQDSRYLYSLTAMYPGGELYSVIYNKYEKGIPESHAKFYAAVVLEALDFMHLKCVIYRDMKAENIVIDKDGYPVIIDLGFAKKIDESTATICGTKLYMAPEVFLQRGYDKSADIWALGILIYEMLYRKTPFYKKGYNYFKLKRAIRNDNVRFPVSNISAEANNLIVKMLNKDPLYRLGCLGRGAWDIRDHEWFDSIENEKLLGKGREAPWRPKVQDLLTKKPPDDDDDDEEHWYDPYMDRVTKEEQALFKDF